jgi:hypothetical protein
MPKKLLSIASATFFLCNPACAQEEMSIPVFSFNGFGTLGLAHSSEDKADFLASVLQGRGAGLGRKWSSDVDSRIGGQVSATFTPQLSAVLQVIAEQRSDTSYRPQVEWGNIKYNFTPDLSVRLGRVVVAGFLQSDSRKVGYAQPWVRPPIEVYGLVPITNSDGVDLSYRQRVGDASHNLQFAYGGASADVPGGGKVTAKNAWLLASTVEYGPATLRVAYSRSKISIEQFAPLFNGYRKFAAAVVAVAPQAAAQANALINQYEPENRSFNFLSLGGSYDPGNWFVMGEWGQTDSRSVLGKREAWYATGGYRWGKFTPYLTYAEAKLKSAQSDVGITAVPGAASLNAVLNEQLSGAPIQKTISVGMRWDFARNTALKLQYDHSRLGRGSPGTLNHALPSFVPGGSFSVFSATLDFVF